jgi:hypothetical protein
VARAAATGTGAAAPRGYRRSELIGGTRRPNVYPITSPAAWCQASTANARVTQPPVFVTADVALPAPIDSSL